MDYFQIIYTYSSSYGIVQLYCHDHLLVNELEDVGDVNLEISAYEGIKKTGSDQMPCILRGVWSESWIFVTYKHLHKNIFLVFYTI